jgi:hypothetical protein
MSNKETEQYFDGLATTLKALQRQNDEIDKLLEKIDKVIDPQKIEQEDTRRGLRYDLTEAASWLTYAFTLYHLVVFIIIQLDIEPPYTESPR